MNAAQELFWSAEPQAESADTRFFPDGWTAAEPHASAGYPSESEFYPF